MNDDQLSRRLGHFPAVTAIVLFMAMAALAFYIHTSTVRFEHAYRDYAVVAAGADAAAYAPGAGNNPVRAELNNALIQILGNTKITSAERLRLARRGMELVDSLDRQVAAITESLEKADGARLELAASADFVSNLFSKGLPGKIVGLTEERRSAVSDVRAYSYRANSETRKILEHIIGDGGGLSSSYIQELNNLIPAQEEEFNLRTNRYADLQSSGDEINATFEEFIKRFGRESRE